MFLLASFENKSGCRIEIIGPFGVCQEAFWESLIAESCRSQAWTGQRRSKGV